MGKRGKGSHTKVEKPVDKDKEKKSTEQGESSLPSEETELGEIVDKKLESSQVVIEYKCRLLAEEALCKSGNTSDDDKALKRTLNCTAAEQKLGYSVLSKKTLDTTEKKSTVKVSFTPKRKVIIAPGGRRENFRHRKGGKISQEQVSQPKPKPDPAVNPTNRRRRKALTQALQRLRKKPQSKRKAKKVSRKAHLSVTSPPTCIIRGRELSHTRFNMDLDDTKEPEERESSPSIASNNGSPDYSPESDDDLSNDGQNESDSELEMQVLEKQVESDKEAEEEEEVRSVDVSLTLPDDTDEESSLLSPSALPASQLFRSPSSRRKKRKSHSEGIRDSENSSKQEDSSSIMEKFTPVVPSYSHSLTESPMSSSQLFPAISPVSSSNVSSMSGSSGPLPAGKRGRGRPRKALEDVKSVSGKLYRKKLADRLIASSSTGNETRPESIYDFEDLHPSEALLPYNSSAYDDDFDVNEPTENPREDFFSDELSHHDTGDPSDPENFHQRLQRWKDRSTFVYAKHKFVSNENKFKCDTCQVSFTALSSLKRHYGTIYHKQQEAAGRSTLDLSDILRPERDSSGGGGDLSSGRGRGRGRPPLARTTSFVRRSAVDNIKKYYAAADAARRRRENHSSGATGGGFTSTWLQKQQRKRKPLLHADYLYTSASADSEAEDGDDDDFGCEDEENNENNSPEDGGDGYETHDVSEDGVVQTPWLSNVWKGTGPPHFTCEVCGEKYTKKFEFTKHLFQHRQEEAKQLELTCPDCLIVFSNEIMLENHFSLFNHGIGVIMRPGKDVQKLTCVKCNSKFTRRDYYRKHVETHKRPLLQCPHCPKKFLHKFYLTDHVKAKHDDGSHGWNTIDNGNAVGSNILGGTSINPISTSVPKPKVELYSSTTQLLIPSEADKRKPSSSVASSSDDTTAAQATASTKDVDVPKFITCDLFEEPPPERDQSSSKERVNLLQKFFDSQKEQDSQSTTDCNSTTEDGKIVFQLEHSMFKGIDENSCNLSPLTIEIPRDNIDDNRNDRNNVVESEENDEHSNDIGSSQAQATSPPPQEISFKTDENEKIESLMHSTNSNSSTTFHLQGCGVKSNLNVLLQPENELQCQDCGKIFEHKKSLIKHVRYYQQVESYPCTLCEKSFKLKHHVARHLKSFHNVDTNSTTSSASDDEHAGLLAIPSSSSSSPAASSSSLGAAERKRSVSDAGKKKEDGDISFSKSNYTTVTDSNGTTAYKCLICKKLYPSKHQISSHLSYHKRSIPYKCSLCSAEFKVKQDLINHQQLHDSERTTKFVCEKCPNSKSFFSRKDLQRHMREKHHQHDELTICRCPSCPLVFPQESDLQTHISQEHTKKGIFEAFENYDVEDFEVEREQGQEDQPASPILDPEPHNNETVKQDQVNDEEQSQEETTERSSSPEFELLELN